MGLRLWIRNIMVEAASKDYERWRADEDQYNAGYVMGFEAAREETQLLDWMAKASPNVLHLAPLGTTNFRWQVECEAGCFEDDDLRTALGAARTAWLALPQKEG